MVAELLSDETGRPLAAIDPVQYPSHLHIDLLECAQGRGQGKAMMQALFQELQAKESPGVWLEMHRDNARAANFYSRLGFSRLPVGGALHDHKLLPSPNPLAFARSEL